MMIEIEIEIGEEEEEEIDGINGQLGQYFILGSRLEIDDISEPGDKQKQDLLIKCKFKQNISVQYIENRNRNQTKLNIRDFSHYIISKEFYFKTDNKAKSDM